MKRGFKIRIYPTKEQKELITKHIGSYRFVWNYMLEQQNIRRKETGRIYSGYELSNLLTSVKKKYPWLFDVSSGTLKIACTNLYSAYGNFYNNNAKLPKFKSRKNSLLKFPLRCEKMYFTESFVQIEKIGHVKYKTDFHIPYGKNTKFYCASLSVSNNKYMLSFSMDCENQAPNLNDYRMGIDLGIKDLATIAFAESSKKYNNINKTQNVKRIINNISYLQKSVNRKYVAAKKNNKKSKSKNIIKQEKRILKLTKRLSGIRSNYIHQTTHDIISYLPYCVTMEILDLHDMRKNKTISHLITQQSFSEFIRQMTYKCEWNSISLIKADRFFPSSKTCSSCGAIKHDLRLSDRIYYCKECGFVIDRDINAAINLMNYITH